MILEGKAKHRAKAKDLIESAFSGTVNVEAVKKRICGEMSACGVYKIFSHTQP